MLVLEDVQCFNSISEPSSETRKNSYQSDTAENNEKLKLAGCHVIVCMCQLILVINVVTAFVVNVVTASSLMTQNNLDLSNLFFTWYIFKIFLLVTGILS